MNKKTFDRKSAAAAKGSPTDKTKCAYCGKPGHNILVCFKLIADQAAAESDGQPGKKIAAATSQNSRRYRGRDRVHVLLISHEKFQSHKHSGNKIIGQFYYLQYRSFYSITNLRAYAGGRYPTLLPTDIILDTGANCSIVHNRSLLTNLKSCKPVIFDGLSGSISITQRESLGTICDAYYHKDIIANILSVSTIKSEGHTLGYENDSDSFYLSHPCGQAIFTRRDNGLYVCNFSPSNVFVSTVFYLESQYTKGEVQEA